MLSELIRTRRAVVSTQIMQEYFAAAIRKLRLSPERITEDENPGTRGGLSQP